MPNTSSKARVAFGFCLLATVIVYFPVIGNTFVEFDDQLYVYANEQVQGGLTFKGLLWAFRTNWAGNWHPVTWVSHMVDCQLFGLNAGGHHFIGLLLHIANALLLYSVLERMTKAPWRCAFVAAAFALHPLHVESVAWISERKDLLSTCFGLLSLRAYAAYVGKEDSSLKRRDYLLCAGFFALALLSKPMWVTLPFLLLLLDFWPLGRVAGLAPAATGSGPETGEATTGPAALRVQPLGLLVREKIPLFALAAASSVVTLIVQKQAGAVMSLEAISLPLRLTNVLVSYLRYIEKMFLPVRLSVFYPFPHAWPVGLVLVAAVFLVGVTILALRSWKRRPYLAVGWLWYVGTLIPVVGLVQVGLQSMADRYTYLPLVGLFIVLAWGLSDLLSGMSHGRAVLAGAAGLALLTCAILARFQVEYWRDTKTLFSHALAVTSENALAEHAVGSVLAKEGDYDAALAHYSEAVRIRPNYREALNDLGLMLVMRGKVDEGIERYREAFRATLNTPELHYNLGYALALKSELEQAISEFNTALRLKPDFSGAEMALARALERRGGFAEARTHWSAVVRREPQNAAALYGLGLVSAAEMDFAAAIPHLEETVRLRPNDPEAHLQLGNSLTGAGRRREADPHYATALGAARDISAILCQRAQAYASKGEPTAALVTYRAALSDDPSLVPAHFGLAALLADQGRSAEAAERLLTVLQLNPDHAEARKLLGLVLAGQEKFEAALQQLSEAARINPADAGVHYHLGVLLSRMRRTAEAIAAYREALKLNPRMPAVLNNLAWILASDAQPAIRNGTEAVRLAEDACQLTGYKVAVLVGTLGAAYAEAGRFDEAAATAKEAEDLAITGGQKDVAERNRTLTALFRSHQPYRESPSVPPPAAIPEPQGP